MAIAIRSSFVALMLTFGTLYARAGQIDPFLAEKLQTVSAMEQVQVIIYLRDQVDLPQMEKELVQMVGAGERVPVDLRYLTILSALQTIAEQTQPVVMGRLAAFAAEGSLSDAERFWIRNLIVARATPRAIAMIASWPEVETVYLDGLLEREKPVHSETSGLNAEAAEPGLRAINAHKIWALGFTGTGRLVMNIDTGVNGNNLAINTRWRGTVPGVNPFWAWHDPSSGSSFPNDGDVSDNHGTHTMGTMCGLYTSGSDTLGVAPSARWIASNSLIGGNPHTSRSIAAFQWAANPDSNLATMDDVPDAISNSWFDPNVTGTECSGASGYWTVIDAVEALGTAVVFSAGNSGPSPSTITSPKNRITTSTNIFAVGALDGNTSTYPIASFSSRGPSTCTGPDSLRIKPEVSAPGVSVRSAFGTNGFRNLSGTSMASPHVAGGIALLRQIAPFLTGTEIKQILLSTARDLGAVGEDNDYGKGMMDLWAAYQALPLNLGYVKGVVSSGGNPLSGVLVDFTNPVQQITGTSNASGQYLAGARIDTPNTTANYTLRAQKFGYITYTDTVTVILADSVTRNITLSPAPGGTLTVRAFRSDSSGIRANVRVTFGGQTVINDSTNATTGLYSTPLPTGSYDVTVDPPSPYGTRRFTGVVISAGQTTTVMAMVRHVIEHAPAAMRDTLAVGQLNSKMLSLTNTTPDSVPFRISDDNALVTMQGPVFQPRANPIPAIEHPKGYDDPTKGVAPIEGLGGPDGFGYRWIDSDEPGGPTFNWVDITSVGTSLTMSDDSNLGPFPLGFTFPFYGNNYTQIRVCSNGWVSFTSTSTAFSNSSIPTTAEPNNALYPFWDDLNPGTGGTVHYYADGANSQFVVQYTNVPFFSGAGTNTFQVILRPNGDAIFQYLSMTGTVLSATVGIENANGSIALQVVNNAAYIHNNLATRLYLPDAAWISENPSTGVLPPSSSANITVTFNAAGLNAGTTYNANIAVDATHPDVAGSILLPASLVVQQANGPLLISNKTSIDFPLTGLGTMRRDSATIQNGGDASLIVSSISTTNPDYAATPASANIAPGDSIRLYVTYTPSSAGVDTGRVVLLSNSIGSTRRDILLTGSSIGMPQIVVTPDSLMFSLLASGDTTRSMLMVRNPGTDTLRYQVTEGPSAGASEAIARSTRQQNASDVPKGVRDTKAGQVGTEGFGGPDAFGYRWIDSDEPNGPAFDWVDITTVGTPLTMSDDSNLGPFPLGFTFSLYGNDYTSIRVCSNGWLSFTSTVTTFANTAIPTAATPNDALYPFWDDLNPATGGTVHYYADAVGQRFIVQYTNVPHYLGTPPEPGLYTFQAIINANGTIVYQYLDMQQTLNSATIGIENLDGTIALQVVYNATYMHNNLAILFTRDLVPWMSVDRSSGTIAPGDSQQVELRIHPAGMTGGNYQSALRFSGNLPDTSIVRVYLTVITDVKSEFTGIPEEYSLNQNYPNPFNPVTTITFGVPHTSDVRLIVYNILGQEVISLANGSYPAGFHHTVWDGRNSSGGLVGSGVYFYRLEARGASGQTFANLKKLLFLK